MPKLLPIRIAKASYRGRRQNNEDSVLAVTFKAQPGNLRALLAVADGMGGAQGGEVASALAVESLKSSLNETLSCEETYSNIRESYHVAHKMIFERSWSSPSLRGMGTTLLTVAVIDNSLIVANVGDSRAYLFASDELKQMTVDHNLSAGSEVSFGGLISVRQSDSDGDMSNCLSRSIGVDESPDEIDFFPHSASQPPGSESHTSASGAYLSVSNGTVCLLCSDGLYKAVSDKDIVEQLLRTNSLDGACENLARLAYHNGSDDNISVCAIEFGHLSRNDDKVEILQPIEGDSRDVSTGSAESPRIGALEKTLMAALIIVFCVLLAAVILVVFL